jgi:hypothetical protein
MMPAPLSRRHRPASAPGVEPALSNPGRELALIGINKRREKFRATARAICIARGAPIPAILEAPRG